MFPGSKFFIKDNGLKLPVHDNYLLPFLSPTAENTHFRQSAPSSDILERQKGRVLLQLHQILHIFQSFGIDLKGKKMLDIGTGNGLIPCLMLEMSDLETAIGIDPYLDGTHQTSWQVHDHNKALLAIKEFLEKHCRDKIDYSTYQHLLEYENYSLRPGTIAYTKQPSKQYLFQQVGAHDLEQLKDSFDIIYCKAIEHIPNWKVVFESIASVAQDHAILYFKHRSFFSYLGAHRYASINTPWGHVLLTEKEYRRFVEEFFPDDAEKIQDFFFKGLTYPRITVSQMIKLARDYDFVPVSILSEPPRYIDTVYNFTEDVDGFWNIVQDNFPELSADELFSGIYHIVFRKAA